MSIAVLRSLGFLLGVILFLPTFVLFDYGIVALIWPIGLFVLAGYLINSSKPGRNTLGWWFFWGMLLLFAYRDPYPVPDTTSRLLLIFILQQRRPTKQGYRS